MSWKQIGLGVILADFSALTAYAVYQHGLIGVFEAAFANVATITLFVDLTIALSLVLAWMWQDARERGTAFVPYALMTLGLGSIGPLLYLLLRRAEVTEPRRASAMARA